MYNMIISAVLAAVFYVTAFVLLGKSYWWLAMLIGAAVFTCCFILIARVVMIRVSLVMKEADKIAGSHALKRAVDELKTAYQYGKWHSPVNGHINSAIGMILYMNGRFSDAHGYLRHGHHQNWVTISMLGVSHMRKRQFEEMVETFEKAIRLNATMSLIWCLYAYCLMECHNKDKACEVLVRAIKELPDDNIVKKNLKLLQNGKRMDMTSYGDLWLQYRLVPINMQTIRPPQVQSLRYRVRR